MCDARLMLIYIKALQICTLLWVRIPQNASKNQTDTKYKFNNLIIYKE